MLVMGSPWIISWLIWLGRDQRVPEELAREAIYPTKVNKGMKNQTFRLQGEVTELKELIARAEE